MKGITREIRGICLSQPYCIAYIAESYICYGIFPIYFFQGLSFLHLEITLTFAKLYFAFEEKLFFSVTIILCNKVILR